LTALLSLGIAPSILASERLNRAIDRLHEEMTLRALARDDLNLPDLKGFRIAVQAHCRLLEARSSLQSSLRANRFAWVDYSQPSNQKRLYLFDLARGELLHQTYATHGVESEPQVFISTGNRTLLRRRGHQETRFFGRRAGSNMSSLGAAVADLEPYFSSTFQSQALRMIGLDAALNSNLVSRAIVFHAWGYTDEMARHGYLPFSQGCLMFPYSDLFEGVPNVDVNRAMISALRGVPVYLYHERLVDPALNERAWAQDLEAYESMKAELALRIEEEGLQGRRGEFEAELERQWLKKAKETRAYFSIGSRYLGQEPKDEEQCLRRWGY
jgi:hypothetical protein